MTVNYATSIAVDNDLLVIQANAFDPLFSSLDEEDAQRIAAIPGVESVEPGIYSWIATEDMPFFLIFGYEVGSQAADHYRIVEGKPVTGPKQIALGRRAMESLEKGIDDSVRLYGVPYRIVGIYETGQAMEESGGLVTLADAQEIAQKPRQVSLFQVGVQRGTDMDQVVSRIKATDKNLSASVASDYDATEQWAGMIEGVRAGHRRNRHPGRWAWHDERDGHVCDGADARNRYSARARLAPPSRRRPDPRRGACAEPRRRRARPGAGRGAHRDGRQCAGHRWFPGRCLLSRHLHSGPAHRRIAGTVRRRLPRLARGQPAARRGATLRRGAGDQSAAGQAFLSHLPGVVGLPFRNLWRRRLRTFISASGIGIGVATLVMLVG